MLYILCLNISIYLFKLFPKFLNNINAVHIKRIPIVFPLEFALDSDATKPKSLNIQTSYIHISRLLVFTTGCSIPLSFLTITSKNKIHERSSSISQETANIYALVLLIIYSFIMDYTIIII